MLEHGFIERGSPTPTVSELLRAKGAEAEATPALVTISAHQKVVEAIDMMHRYSISQLPVVRDGDLGSRGLGRLDLGPRPPRTRVPGS
jgi:CBS domain-containing protein